MDGGVFVAAIFSGFIHVERRAFLGVSEALAPGPRPYLLPYSSRIGLKGSLIISENNM